MSEIDNTRLNSIKSILDELNIDQSYIDHMLRFNNWQPYHNIQHLITVALKVYEGAVHYNLDFQSKRILVISALLHDLAHSADSNKTDIENVMLSSNLAAELIADDDSFSAKNMERIVTLIVGTENTRTLVSNDPLQGILNDADLMQSFEPDYKKWFDGLSEETGSIVNIDTTVKFYKTKIPHTEWGYNIFENGTKKLEGMIDD